MFVSLKFYCSTNGATSKHIVGVAAHIWLSRLFVVHCIVSKVFITQMYFQHLSIIVVLLIIMKFRKEMAQSPSQTRHLVEH